MTSCTRVLNFVLDLKYLTEDPGRRDLLIRHLISREEYALAAVIADPTGEDWHMWWWSGGGARPASVHWGPRSSNHVLEALSNLKMNPNFDVSTFGPSSPLLRVEVGGYTIWKREGLCPRCGAPAEIRLKDHKVSCRGELWNFHRIGQKRWDEEAKAWGEVRKLKEWVMDPRREVTMGLFARRVLKRGWSVEDALVIPRGGQRRVQTREMPGLRRPLLRQ